MYHGEWTFRACPQCTSDQIRRTVRANVTTFDCLSCRYQWTVRRMPSNAEAVQILRRSREKILPEDTGSTQLDADSDRSARFRVHAVRFYPDDRSLCGMAAEFLRDGLMAGEPAVIVATPSHCEGIVRALDVPPLDVNELRRTGEMVLLDAAETLAAIVENGEPDVFRFKAILTEALDTACGERRDRCVRIYGEMVDLLWTQNMREAAIRLETLWNELATTRHFSLLCGYSTGHSNDYSQVRAVCEKHTHVISADSPTRQVNWQESA